MTALAALLLLAAPAPTTDPVQVYEDWSVTCDDLASCVAISADLGEPAPVVMRIVRGGGWERLPDLRIHLPGEVAGTVSLRLATLDPASDPERRRRTHFRLYRTDAGDYALAASDTQAFFHAARAARTAQVLNSIGAEIGMVPLRGLVAAMDRFDHVQTRTGTITGIYSRGAILVPLAAIMPPPTPLLHPLEGSAEVVDRATASRLHRLVCGSGAVRHADDVEIGAMADRTWIAGIDCGLSGLNAGRVWMLLQADGSFSRAIFALPYLGDDDTGFGFLENSHFDPETGVMEALALQREVGDCGTWHRWQWSPAGFRLLEARVMRICVGLARHNWPHVWRAQRVGLPPQTEGVQDAAPAE